MMCLLFARPLLDIAYFPIQLKVIDYVAEKEKEMNFRIFLIMSWVYI